MSSATPQVPQTSATSAPQPADFAGDDTLARLAEVIESRRGADPDRSYVARLFAKGTDAMLKKVGEEATEVVMAAKDGDPVKLTAEMADLWFHALVVLAAHGLRPADVLAELRRREGMSGLEEFALRKQIQREAHEGADQAALRPPAPLP
jgi:phosphoribosyl-ATP pyrophosphohydrolase